MDIIRVNIDTSRHDLCRYYYISYGYKPLTQEDLIDIELSSEINNTENEVSRILYIYKHVNYQILGGVPEHVEIIANKIRKDPRHQIRQEFISYGLKKEFIKDGL